MANKTMLAMSQPVPKAGWVNCVTLGEFKIVTGSEHVHTQNIWLGGISERGLCLCQCYSQHPEAKEGPEFVPLVIETVVLSRPDDPK